MYPLSNQADRHPLVTQVRVEASSSPAAGTPCAAALIAVNIHHQPLESRHLHRRAQPSQRLPARATQT